ncbi:MAG: tetratricopeptide repeat protein [Flavobacteriales bacterium]|nr:tetratricopeptide repeat protein [Flavobacteriales bacterium]
MKRGQLIAVVGTLFLGVAIWLAPTKPNQPAVAKVDSVSEKINQAVELISSGKEPPMAGITLLREVLEEDPQNVEAHFYLGYFSVQSGQYDKAVERFLTVLEINPERDEARYLLGMSYLEINDTSSALTQLRMLAQGEGEKEIKKSAIKAINELEKL